MPPQWLLVAVVVGGAIHALAIAYAFYLHRRVTSAEGRDHDDAPSDRTVACPSCGSTNERSYRFCAECVEELPGETTVLASGSRPSGRSLP